jgi:hypothetical protein
MTEITEYRGYKIIVHKDKYQRQVSSVHYSEGGPALYAPRRVKSAMYWIDRKIKFDTIFATGTPEEKRRALKIIEVKSRQRLVKRQRRNQRRVAYLDSINAAP